MLFSDQLFPSQTAWLALLFVLWAGLLFGGFIFGRRSPDGSRRMPAWTRMASSLVLVVAAWSWFIFSTQRASPLPLLVAIGMTLGCLGDFFMARLLPVRQPVLGGIASFGLGHVAYIAAILLFTAQGPRASVQELVPGWGAWLFWLLVGLAGWYFVVWRGQRHTVLHRAALPYALLLASTAGFATGLALQAPSFLPMALGAALFLISDLILAAHLFNDAFFPLIDDVVWLTYGPGQMLIVSGIGGALAFLRTFIL